MVLTDEKITVTTEMLDAASMIRGTQYGIPNPKGGLIWKELYDMGDEDFGAIEDYFIKKQKD